MTNQGHIKKYTTLTTNDSLRLDKHNYEWYSLMRLFEEYSIIYTGHKIKLSSSIKVAQKFKDVSYVIGEKDPRVYFNALFSCYSLYTPYKSNRGPDLDKLLDSKVLNVWSYLIANSTQLNNFNKVIGSESIIINCLCQLYYGIRDFQKITPDLISNYYDHISEDQLSVIERGLEIINQFPTLEHEVTNLWSYTIDNIGQYLKYLYGFDLMDLPNKTRSEIISIAKFIGTCNNYQEIGNTGKLTVDRSGCMIWKKH